MPGGSAVRVCTINAFFVLLFVLSALLFRRASATERVGRQPLDSTP